MLTDTGDYHTCPLASGFIHHDFSHDGRIHVVEMADRFIEKKEIKRLNQGTNHGNTLLLPETHQADFDMELIGNAKALKPFRNLGFRLAMGQIVLDFDILKGREFREQPKFLKQMTHMLLAYFSPIVDSQGPGVGLIEENVSLKVMTIAQNVATQC